MDDLKQLAGEPGVVPGLLKAALPSIPVVSQLPGVRKASLARFDGLGYRRDPVTIARHHVERYARVCGFPDRDTVPLPYPHMIAQPLHMAILGDTDFPAPAIGTVHLENSITSHRPIHVGETVAATASVGAPVPHRSGLVYRFVSEVRADDGELVWESVSSYLRRGKGDKDAPGGLELPDVEATSPPWRLPADLGRQYASVSGDYNPIHLYPLTAKALGFPRQIAHGMWSKARCIAAIENRLPDAVRVDVAWKKPILLPGAVSFGVDRTDDGYAFTLVNPKSGAPHLKGSATALTG